MADDLGKQVELQNELNNAIKASIGLLKQQGRLMSQQAGYAKDMCDSLKCANLEDLHGQTEELNQGLKKTADGAQDAGDKMSKAANKAGGSFQGLLDKGPKIGLMAGAFRGVVGAVKGTFETFKNLGSILGGVISTFAKLGQSIIMLPFKMMTGLIKMSQKGAVDPLRKALEEVRGEMGNLATNEGKMMANSAKEIQGSMGDLAGTGISVGRIFGYGRQGVADALKYAGETATAMGIAFGNLGPEWKKNVKSLIVYRKALGLTAEQQATQLKVAKARGVSIEAETTAFASMAINMGKTFGVNAKQIGKAMGEMQADVSSFGHLSKKELGTAATYAAKLGVEIKDLQSVMDKFDSFESAAKGAAEMAQTFGMNIDAMDLLNAKDGAQQIDMLRKSFFDTGKTLKDLNRHERKLLETQTGLTGAALEGAFANENMGMSYDDIAAGADDAEKKQLTQAEAMKDLGKSIEKMVKSGEHGFNSFFDAFAGGFTKGIQRSKLFRKLMRNLQRSLKVIYRAGIKVGRMFVKMFPGVKDVLGGLAKMFDPKRFKQLAKGLKKTFKTFFKDLQKDPEKAVKKFVKSFQRIIKKHLGGGGAGLNQVKEGFKKFFKAASSIVAELIPIIKKKIAEGLETLVDLVTNPPSSVIGAAGKKAGGFIMSIFGPIFDALKGNPKLNKRIWDALSTVFTTLWTKIQASTWYIKISSWLTTIMVTKIILSAIANAIGGAVIGKGIGMLTAGFGKMFGGGLQAAGDQVGSSGASAKAKTNILAMLGALLGIMAMMGLLAVAYKKAGLTPSDALGIGTLMVAVAATFALMAPGMAIIQEMETPGEEMIKKILAMGGMLLVLGGVGLILTRILAEMKTPSLGAVAAWSAVMLVMMAVSLPLLAAVALISKMQTGMAEAIKGMVVLGLLMVGIGVVGTVIAGMLSLIPNPAGVGTLMEAISSIMYATMLMIPVAIALAALIIGSGGLALPIILGAFGYIGSLATVIIASLIPAIIGLSVASNKIKDPAKFKAVSGALIGIMGTVGTFLEAAGGIIETLKPPSGDPKKFQDSMKSFGELIDGLMKAGITDIMTNMVALAKSDKVSEAGLKAVGAVTGVLSAVGGILSAFSPSAGEMQAVTKAAETWGGDEVGLMEKMNDRIRIVMRSLPGILVSLGSAMASLMKAIQPALEAVTSSAVKPASLTAFGGILESVFGSMGSLMGAVGAMAGAVFAKGDPEKNIRLVNTMMKQMITSFSTLGPNIKNLVAEIVTIAEGDAFKKGSGLKKRVKLLGTVLESVATIADIFAPGGPLENTQTKGSSTVSGSWSTPKTAASMNDVATLLLQKNGPVEKMVNAMHSMKAPPKGSTKRIKSIAKMLSALAELGKSIYVFAHQSFKSEKGIIESNLRSMSGALASLSEGGELPSLLSKIKKLSKIPKALAKASKQMGKISKRKMRRHIKKAVGMIEFINNALVDAADNTEFKMLTPKRMMAMAAVGDLIGEVADIASNTIKLTNKAADIPDVETVKAGLDKMANALRQVRLFAIKATMQGGFSYEDAAASIKHVAGIVKIVDSIAAMPNLANVDKAVNVNASIKTLAGVVDHLDIFGNMSGEGMQALDDVSFGLTQLDKIMASPLLSDPDKAAAIVRSVQTMKGLLTPINETVAEVQAFSGGELNVTHNLPNTQINMQVNINSKELATAIALTDIGKDPAVTKAFMATQPTPAISEG